MTQNNLGIALEILGERESGTGNLRLAMAAYQQALEVRRRDKVPLEWAETQNGLGGAFLILGQRESGTENLRAAVYAYKLALEERRREKVPLDWAATQSNLGNALENLGEREFWTEDLSAAVTAYQHALEEHTRDKVPLNWAATQDNPGIALHALGERERSLPSCAMPKPLSATPSASSHPTTTTVLMPNLSSSKSTRKLLHSKPWAESSESRARLQSRRKRRL